VLFTARSTSTLMVPVEDVALVNQQPISRSDYLMQLQSLYNIEFSHATREQRQKVLKDMIREELFVQRGKELDVASTDPDVRNALVNAVELEIASDAITSQPTEAALRSYYQAHPERYSSEGIMTVEDYVFPANGAAVSQAIDALKTRTPTPDLIARFGGKSSGKVGDEEFYFAAKIHLGDRLFEAARGLAQGGASAPIEMADGIHVLYMQKNVKPALLDFAASRDKVLSDYRNERIRHLTTGDEAFLRKRANVLIADDLR
jgi:PPIC-type PPIASE domain/SurA N-terminal domain